MKLLACVFLFQAIVHMASANPPPTTAAPQPEPYLLTREQENYICAYGLNVTNLCASSGPADRDCDYIAKLVKGSEPTCKQEHVCSFKAGGHEVVKSQELARRSDPAPAPSAEIKVEPHIVYVSSNKALNFEKIAGYVRICVKNIFIVNQRTDPNEIPVVPTLPPK